MALQFREPPDWLMQEYVNRKQPIEQVNEGIGNALNTYAAYAQQNKLLGLKQQEADRQKQEQAMKASEHAYNYGDTQFMSPTDQSAIDNPIQGPATETGQPAYASPRIARFKDFLAQNPQGIKGREKQMAGRPQQAPFLINNKPAVFNPQTSQYEIAQVVDPTVPQTPSVVPTPKFTPRTEPQPSFQFAGTQGGQPVLLNSKTGQMSAGALPGTGPLMSSTQTEGQGNAKLYAQRMEEADNQLNDLSSRVDLASMSAGIQGAMPNIAKSPEIQLFEQSKRNFLNAVLRRESGAVISPTEFAEGNKQYFDVLGDSPVVKKQKAMNRQTAIAGLRNAAGEAPIGTGEGIPQIGQAFQGGRVKKVTRIQ